MKYIFEWDDIPSMEGVDVDWGFKLETPHGKREFVRITKERIPRLFEVSTILIKVATVKQTYNGTLLNISAGGLAMSLPVPLEVDLPLKVGFYLGPEKIISKAIVKYTHKIEEPYTTGVEFVDFDSEHVGYINGLYATLGQLHAF